MWAAWLSFAPSLAEATGGGGATPGFRSRAGGCPLRRRGRHRRCRRAGDRSSRCERGRTDRRGRDARRSRRPPPLLGIATGEEAAHIAYPDGPALPALPGEIRSVEVMVRNDGNELWQATGANPVMLSYHLYDASGHLIAWDGLRTTLPFDISPGYDGALALRVALPARTGTYSIKPDLIRDGRAWFSSLGTPQSAFPLRVTSDLDATY